MTADVWTFGPHEDEATTYADGTTVPHRHQDVLLNGVKIGYVEIHMHKRRGRDRKTDVSFGITTCVYGPAPGGS
jgi:hypothetical protein